MNSDNVIFEDFTQINQFLQLTPVSTEQYLTVESTFSDVLVIPTVTIPETTRNDTPPVKQNTSTTLHCKKGERYLPQFKKKVVAYTKQHTFKETSEKYGVHQATVSEWSKASKKTKLFEEAASLQVDVGTMFIAWLRKCRLERRRLLGDDVQLKLDDLTRDEAALLGSDMWLVDLKERFKETVKSRNTTHIRYPNEFKVEVVEYSKRYSENSASKVFGVSRKRIFDWSKTNLSVASEKPPGRKVTHPDVDKEVWVWYCIQNAKRKVSGREVCKKAQGLIDARGGNVKCSQGWYAKWRRRFNVSTRYEHDSEILEWVLLQFDQNKSVSHHDIQKVAMDCFSRKQTDFKASAGFVIRFCKRHPQLLQTISPPTVKLPDHMEETVTKFRSRVRSALSTFPFHLIGCMDEIPISFSPSVLNNKQNLLRQCSMDNCHAIVLLSVLADGGVLPPVIVLRGNPRIVLTTGCIIMYRNTVSVDAELVCNWLETVWFKNVQTPNFLLLDCYTPHVGPVVDKMFKLNASFLDIIPGGLTCKLQPLNMHINSFFTSEIEKYWEKYLNNISNFPNGKFRAPDDELIIKWVSSVHELLKQKHEKIRQSFLIVGLTNSDDGSQDHIIGNLKFLTESKSPKK